MSLQGQNIIVFDCETLRSADACIHCDRDKKDFDMPPSCSDEMGHVTIGWENKAELSLSVMCFYDYKDEQYSFVGIEGIENFMRSVVVRQALMVGFNSVAFDGPLLRAILRNQDPPLHGLCDVFKAQMAQSYDILREIWKLDSKNHFAKGNSLGAIRIANGLAPKEMDGATAPRLWAQGEQERVREYCKGDVAATKQLFEWACEGRSFLRGNGLPITLPRPRI